MRLRALAIAVVLAALAFPQLSVAAPSDQPVFDRVMKDRTLRCSYFNYAPYVYKDPNTGKLAGSFYELTEKLGKVLNLKIQWMPETTFTTFVPDMTSGRYDVFCGGLWPLTDSAPYMTYTDSVFYTPYYIYVRASDHRFDKDASLLNNPKYKFATIDGEGGMTVKQSDFPNSGKDELPNTTDIAQLLLEVTNGRADATVIEPSVANLYLKTNPGKVRALSLRAPVRVFATVWAVPANEQKLANWLNNGVKQMLASGYVEPIVSKYHPAGTYFPVAKPYVITGDKP